MAVALFGNASMDVALEVPAEFVQARDWMIWTKVFVGDLVGVDGGGVQGRRSPHWGCHLGAQFLMHWVLWVQILSRFWTSDGGATGVVPSLKASSLETSLGKLAWSRTSTSPALH